MLTSYKTITHQLNCHVYKWIWIKENRTYTTYRISYFTHSNHTQKNTPNVTYNREHTIQWIWTVHMILAVTPLRSYLSAICSSSIWLISNHLFPIISHTNTRKNHLTTCHISKEAFLPLAQRKYVLERHWALTWCTDLPPLLRKLLHGDQCLQIKDVSWPHTYKFSCYTKCNEIIIVHNRISLVILLETIALLWHLLLQSASGCIMIHRHYTFLKICSVVGI